MNYHPGAFSDAYDTDLGQSLWAFLHEHANIVRMETATYLARPAVEALGPILLTTFGEAVRVGRIKQMIGSMIRQIMEAKGYQIDRQNVRVPPNRKDLFTSGTRYKLAA